MHLCSMQMHSSLLGRVYHGGPQGSTGDDWQFRWNLQSYASAGFAVLGVNFRGSTGFGHAFCRAISASGPDAVGWNVGASTSCCRTACRLPELGASAVERFGILLSCR